MQVRTLVIAALGVALLLGAWFTIDSLIASEEEALETFTDAVSGEITDERIEAAFAYVDLSAVPFEVSLIGSTRVYEEGEIDNLRRAAALALGPYKGNSLRVITRDIRIDGSTAHVTIAMSTGRGLARLEYRLKRVAESQWRVERLRLGRD